MTSQPSTFGPIDLCLDTLVGDTVSTEALTTHKLAPLERQASISDRVFQRLRDSIVEHELESGQPLVIEQLASMLGVSRTPIREALSGLLQCGLIEETTAGFRVAPIDAAYVWQVYSLRSVLESLAAEAVAPVLTDDDIATLHRVAFPRTPPRRRDRPITSGDGYAFHDQIHAFVRAKCPLPYLNTLIDSALVHHRRLRDLEQRVQVKESYHEHLAIFEALKRRDGAASRTLMQAHLDRIGMQIVGVVADPSPGANPHDDNL